MKYLIIEDDPNKAKNLLDFINEYYHDDIYYLCKSYQSGVKALFQDSYDLVLLDMQLPTFDIRSGEDGYRFRKTAGIDIMNEVKRKKKNCKFIIVTQFETFGEGESYMDLSDLKNQLKRNFKDLYIDTVYYKASLTLWKEALRGAIDNFKKQDNG